MANIFNRPMFRKGGKVRKEEDYVSYTDYGRSGVIYKDEKGKPLTKEEFFQMLDKEESREMKAGGGIMSGIVDRKNYQEGGSQFLEDLRKVPGILGRATKRTAQDIYNLGKGPATYLFGSDIIPQTTEETFLGKKMPSFSEMASTAAQASEVDKGVGSLVAQDPSTMLPQLGSEEKLPEKKGEGITLEGRGEGAEEVKDDKLQEVRDYVETAKSLMPESDAASNLLINLGLRLISQPKRGGTLATIAEAAKDPVAAFQKEKAAEKQTDIALISKGLDRLDKDDLDAITKRAKAGVKAGYFKTLKEGMLTEFKRIYEDDPYRKEKSPATLKRDRKRELLARNPMLSDGELEEIIDYEERAKKYAGKYRIRGDKPRKKPLPDTVYRDPVSGNIELHTSGGNYVILEKLRR